jgi:uncharacterized protein involved in type VI secretion and phage assembly
MTATGSRSNGTYFVTRVRHRIPQKGPFETEFWATGMSSGTLASLVTPDAGRNPLEPRRPINGFMIGIVTNCADPDALYRVKVKFPTLSEDLESAWAPVVTIGAGPERGFAVLPEVNDEVLVGFEHGDIHRPFVLGGLYNKNDTPPQGQTVLHSDGKTEVREWKTRVGHIIRLTDTSGEEKIEIIDKKTANSIVIDSANDTITMKANKDIILEAKNGLIKLEAMNVKITASSGLEGSGTNTKMEAKASLQLKGATADFVASGMAKVSGSMVMIN